jgi:hypothetical protein
MKNILEAMIGLLALMLMIYVPFAFLIAEWNPMSWHLTFRGLYVLCILGLVTFAVKEYQKK